ncbi:MAG TPA: hypothetical protein VKR26_07055, partial [Terriglobales bacterium]|nr:hypothetical protein [Terriglobales bacterium]
MGAAGGTPSFRPPAGGGQLPSGSPPAPASSESISRFRESYIAGLAAAGIAAHFVLHYLAGTRAEIYNLPLYATLAIGGVPLLMGLTRRL